MDMTYNKDSYVYSALGKEYKVNNVTVVAVFFCALRAAHIA